MAERSSGVFKFDLNEHVKQFSDARDVAKLQIPDTATTVLLGECNLFDICGMYLYQ